MYRSCPRSAWLRRKVKREWERKGKKRKKREKRE